MNELNTTTLDTINAISSMIDVNNMTSGITKSIDDGSFAWGLFFGIVGMSYSVFGKKSDNLIFLFSGIGLMGYTYVVTGLMSTLLVGITLTVIPFVIKR